METVKRAVSLLLCFVMVVGLLPMSAFAATGDDALSTALTEAKAYIDALTVNNSANDPSEVVANHGVHFTWDNEMREKKQLYLYDWSYYNGVVFEGLQYLYEVTGEEAYKDYVIEYLSALIDANGDWAVCTNDSEKTAAGYVDHHGADCYKTASLLLDAYDMTGDARYLTMAEQLYLDLNAEDNSNVVLLADAGNNYRHNWSVESTYGLWLDGLYMILPFRAEYAAHIGDAGELDLIVERLTWVSDNMYNDNGLFYHAANTATENSGTYWLRSIGWYAAAIADVMDSVSDADRKILADQLMKLADGLWDLQGSNGMWLNDLAAAESNTNPYETSGTALVAYAVLKAVNNGWLEEAYADMAINAFVGICDNKLENNDLTDICFKGVPGGSNSTYYSNEGKGVGPFIMLTAEAQKYADEHPVVSEPNNAVVTDIRVAYTRETLMGDELDLTVYAVYSDGSEAELTEGEYTVEGYDPDKSGSQGIVVTYGDFSYGFNVVTLDGGVTVVGKDLYGMTAADVTDDETVAAAMADVETNGFVAYDFTANTNAAVVSIPVPAEWAEGKLVAYYIDENGKIAETIPAEYANGKAVFEVKHFSTYAVSNEPMATAETGWVAYEGANYYEKVTSMAAGTPYVITRYSINSYSTIYALNRSSTSAVASAEVDVSQNSDGTYDIETVTDSMTWYMDSEGHIYSTVNGTNYYLNASYSNGYSLSVSTTASSEWTVTASSGNVTIRTSVRRNNSNQTVYLRYTSNNYGSGSFGVNTSSSTLSLYAKRAQAGGQARLTGTLDQTVRLNDGTTQDTILSKVTVEWDSNSDGVSDSTIALADCSVTGSYNNAATGDYTLTVAYNGKTLGNVTVHVVDKSIVEGSGVLSGNTPVSTKLNMHPEFPDLKLTVTYDDGTTGIITTANGLKVDGYDISEPGIYECTVTYGGVEYGTVWVTVGDNLYEGRDEATVYPEYPEDGAVRIDKTATELDFATTGLVNVELDVAGVSVRGGVDAVLTIDISNSMAWAVGDNIDNFEHNKLTDVMAAVKDFAEVLLAPNEDGTPTNNTISIVYFAGKDNEHWAGGSNSQVDAVLTACSKISDINIINDIADKTKFTGRDSSNEYLIQIAHVNDAGRVVTYSGQNRGDTNYDYAFWQTEQAVDQIIAANGENSNREIHVLLMTDGCATHFNNVYYNSGSVGNYYRPGTRTTYGSDGNFKTLGGVAWAQWIQESITENFGNIYARSLYEKVDGGYAVGFDMAHGSFSGITDWGDSSIHWDIVFNEIVQNTVQDEEHNGMINVTNATDTDILNKFYRDLANNLLYAGTSANVSDIIDPDFTLQLGNFTGTEGKGVGVVDITDKGYTPSITIKTYDLWTKLETDDVTKIGTRKGTSQDIETVTFNADGTKAYSDLIDEGKTNILSVVNGVTTIDAHYFTYTKTPDGVETFNWKIGNITDKEITLSYYAYLKGSLEGEEADGLKYTNEEATLEYIDINGYYAKQTFPIPAVAWGGASTAYEFYLVNEDGDPCDRNGNVIPFANRIIITGPYYEALYLNQGDENIAEEIIAAYVLPAGYTLYDETAKYTVQTASGDNKGSLKISEPGFGLITEEYYNGQRYEKVIHEDGTVTYEPNDEGTYKKVDAQTTIQVYPEPDSQDTSFIQSRVAFGVVYNLIPTTSSFVIAPDQVVIDYGKSIVINVNKNNTDIPSDVTATLIGFSMFYENFDPKQQFSNTSCEPVYKGTYGTFTINADNNVVYTPHKLINSVGKIFCHYRIVDGTDTYYMVSELDVIPATIMYYETDFADGVFTEEGAWSTKSDDTDSDGPQNDGTIGQNTYGFDTTYDNDAYLSNGTSEFVLGEIDDQGNYLTTASFSFTGTGFDLISRTGENQGLIKVQVATDSAMTNIVKTVSVLNKSESNLELYQIPVVSINDLPHSTYYVKISVDTSFENTTGIPALNALARGNEFYFDAIRIYDPAEGNAIAEAAYNADGEANNSLDEVRALLLNAETYATISGTTTGMVFIDRDQTNTSVVADYATIGPNNEVYLSKDQAVAFKVDTNSIPASFDIGAKSIEGNIAGLQVTVIKNDRTTVAWTDTATIESSTVQYIDLLDAAGADASVLYQGAYVVITNTADGVLSITDLKTAFSVAAAAQTEQLHSDLTRLSGVSLMSEAAEVEAYDPFAVSYTVDAGTFDVAKTVLTAPAEPEIPETPDEPEIPDEPEVDTSVYNILSASVKTTGSFKSRKYTITVVTSQMVEDILVMSEGSELAVSKITSKDKKKTDTREWTIVLTAKGLAQYNSFTLTGVGSDDLMGEAFEVSTSSNHGRNDK